MTSDLTRRTALGFFTVAGIAAVSGCSNSIFSSTSVKTHTPSSSDSSEPATTSSDASPSSSSASSTSASPSSSSSSSSSSSDYSSEVKIDKYDTSAGNFEAATKEHPARNVPKPVKPEKMSENSAEGLKAALGYLSAALKYYYLTGETEFLREVRLSEDTLPKYESKGAPIREKRSWYGSPDVKIYLNSPEPTKSGDKYMWPFTAKTDQGPFIVKDGEYRSLSSARRYGESRQMAVGTYEGGHWTIIWHSRSSSSSSPTRSPSSSSSSSSSSGSPSPSESSSSSSSSGGGNFI